jgi:hypothetical protein
MKLATGVVEFGVAVINRDLPFEGFVNLHPSASEAEAFGLGRDLEATPVPLHDVVIADAALMHEAADAVQIFRSGAPRGFCFARSAGEAPVVIPEESAEDLVGGVQIGRAGEAKFAGEAILKGAPQPFDASLGLRRVGSDVGDAELGQGAAELGGLTLSRRAVKWRGR